MHSRFGLKTNLTFNLPKIYPITDARLSGISHAVQVERLIEGGATFIQLREKHSSSRDFYESAARAIDIARKSGVKIIINDRVDIAFALDADGVHLGQDDLPPEYARKILGDDAIIGFSTHSPEQACAAAGLPVSYITIGPIFATQTKEDSEPAVGLEGLSKAKDKVGNFPLVAIGGITSENLESVFKAGADSAAIIRDLVSSADNISSKIQEFLNFNLS